MQHRKTIKITKKFSGKAYGRNTFPKREVRKLEMAVRALNLQRIA